MRKFGFKYRRNRRASEVERAIKSHFNSCGKVCLDIGARDGFILDKLNRQFHFSRAMGIDPDPSSAPCNGITLRKGNAESLEFPDKHFDIIILTSTIEHVNDPDKMLSECRRTLKPEGILIITTANPFFVKIALKLRYFTPDEESPTKLTLENITSMLAKNDFKVLHTKYFEFCPFFKIPLETGIESVLNSAKLGKIMFNQLIVAESGRGKE